MNNNVFRMYFAFFLIIIRLDIKFRENVIQYMVCKDVAYTKKGAADLWKRMGNFIVLKRNKALAIIMN